MTWKVNPDGAWELRDEEGRLRAGVVRARRFGSWVWQVSGYRLDGKISAYTIGVYDTRALAQRAAEEAVRV